MRSSPTESQFVGSDKAKCSRANHAATGTHVNGNPADSPGTKNFIKQMPSPVHKGVVFKINGETHSSGIYFADNFEDPSHLCIVTGAYVSICPKSFATECPVGALEMEDCTLTTVTGQDIKIFGQKDVPFKLGNRTISLKFVVANITRPLIAANDLLKKGVSLHFGPGGSFIAFGGQDFPLVTVGNFYFMAR